MIAHAQAPGGRSVGGLHSLLAVSTGCNPCRASETYVNVAFRRRSQGLAAGEKLLQKGAALDLEDAAADVDAMVEPWIAYHIKQ
jgi:hypothetical protein